MHKIDDIEVLSWLYFMADVYVMEYYFDKFNNYKKMKSLKMTNESMNSTYINSIKMKYVDQYIKITNQYQEYFEKLIGNSFKSNYKTISFLEEEHFLYDIMTLNQEFILHDFMTLNGITSNLHEKMVFCYRHYISGWNSKKILQKLRKKTLDKIFINFVNEYSKQSGLPQVVVLCYFYPLEEELAHSTKELTKLNEYFTRIDIDCFLAKTSSERKIFIKNIIDKRINSIDKWCTRTKERIIESTILLLSKINKMVP